MQVICDMYIARRLHRLQLRLIKTRVDRTRLRRVADSPSR
jgi:hypothetical protein